MKPPKRSFKRHGGWGGGYQMDPNDPWGNNAYHHQPPNNHFDTFNLRNTFGSFSSLIHFGSGGQKTGYAQSYETVTSLPPVHSGHVGRSTPSLPSYVKNGGRKTFRIHQYNNNNINNSKNNNSKNSQIVAFFLFFISISNIYKYRL